jgi:hypothetical protein
MQALQPDLCPSFASTREALHRVAEQLVAPARKPHNEIALRQTPGGFGTPPFEFGGETIQVRVEGAGLVVERDGVEERIELTSLADAGARLGPKLLPDGMPEDATPLEIDPEGAEQLAAFYAFADRALRQLRDGLPAEAEATEINLWPEHFDLAFEAGSDAAGLRANYGASPGDAEHPEPYLYVGPWTADVEGELWNANAFNGAELSYADLAAPGDQHARTAGFFGARLDALSGA